MQTVVVSCSSEDRGGSLHVEGRGQRVRAAPFSLRPLLLLDLLLLDVVQVRSESLRGLHALRAGHHRAAVFFLVQNTFSFRLTILIQSRSERKRVFLACDWLVFDFCTVAGA